MKGSVGPTAAAPRTALCSSCAVSETPAVSPPCPGSAAAGPACRDRLVLRPASATTAEWSGRRTPGPDGVSFSGAGPRRLRARSTTLCAGHGVRVAVAVDVRPCSMDVDRDRVPLVTDGELVAARVARRRDARLRSSLRGRRNVVLRLAGAFSKRGDSAAWLLRLRRRRDDCGDDDLGAQLGADGLRRCLLAPTFRRLSCPSAAPAPRRSCPAARSAVRRTPIRTAASAPVPTQRSQNKVSSRQVHPPPLSSH